MPADDLDLGRTIARRPSIRERVLSLTHRPRRPASPLPSTPLRPRPSIRRIDPTSPSDIRAYHVARVKRTLSPAQLAAFPEFPYNMVPYLESCTLSWQERQDATEKSTFALDPANVVPLGENDVVRAALDDTMQYFGVGPQASEGPSSVAESAAVDSTKASVVFPSPSTSVSSGAKYEPTMDMFEFKAFEKEKTPSPSTRLSGAATMLK